MVRYLRIGGADPTPGATPVLRAGSANSTWRAWACCTIVVTGTITVGDAGEATGGFDAVEEAADGLDDVGGDVPPDTVTLLVFASAGTSTLSFARSTGTWTVFCHASY